MANSAKPGAPKFEDIWRIAPLVPALRAAVERENEIFAQFYEMTSIEPAGEMWEAIRARIDTEPQRQAQIEMNSGWLERLRARAFSLLAPAKLRQAAFAALLIAVSVAATTIYLKRGDDGRKKLAVTTVTPTATPAPTSTPQIAPSVTDRGVSGGSNPSKDTGEDIGKDKRGNTIAQKGGDPSNHRSLPARKFTDQELMNLQIARAEREYQKAIRMLDQAIAKRRDSLDSELIKQYESSMAMINDSIATSRRVLRERPDDPVAGQFLLAAYAKKLDLMQDIAMK